MTVFPIRSDSREFVPVEVTLNGAPVLNGVELSLTSVASPSSWRSAEVIDNEVGLVVGPGAISLSAGEYEMRVRITRNPEAPVVVAGLVRVS